MLTHLSTDEVMVVMGKAGILRFTLLKDFKFSNISFLKKEMGQTAVWLRWQNIIKTKILIDNTRYDIYILQWLSCNIWRVNIWWPSIMSLWGGWWWQAQSPTAPLPCPDIWPHAETANSERWQPERLIRCFVAEEEQGEAAECQEEERIAKLWNNQSLVSR